MTVVVTKNYFSGMSNIHDAGPNGLAAIIRGLATGQARTTIFAASLAGLVDSSGGTKGNILSTLNLVTPSGLFNATVAGGVQTTAFNTSLGKIRNAQVTIASRLRVALGKLGLPPVVSVEGTDGLGTIAAMDLTATTAAGAAAVSYASFVAAANIAVINLQALTAGMNSLIGALGGKKISAVFVDSNSTAAIILRAGNSVSMLAIPAVVSDATGANSVKLSDGTLFLATMAANMATLASYYNRIISGAGTNQTLTDSTGGTASATSTLVAINFAQTPYQDVATASAPSTGINALLLLYRNALSSIQDQLNTYYENAGLALVADSTGGVVSQTLAVETIALTAVNGTTDSVSAVSLNASLHAVANNIATLARQINAIVANQAQAPLIDSSGGTAGATLVAIPATVFLSNTSAAVGVLNTAAITAITAVRNDISTLAAALNFITANAEGGIHSAVIAG